jgi:tight adherence protein B
VSRYGFVIAAFLLVGMLVGPPASSAGAGIELTEAGGARFPERAFVIGLPSERRTLVPGDVLVTENGSPVVDETVVPASAVDPKAFGVVLVVDASDSMAGSAIRGAMVAARAFASQRNANQQLAFLTFNSGSRLLLPFTSSTPKIDAALATTPSLAYGTHIFDAVARAERMLAAAGVESGSIVVLSDGADTGSRATLETVARASRAAHIRLFTIGLRSPHFDSSTLSSLAGLGGGEYASSDSPDGLTPLFDQLGARLASEYLLRYKSLAGPKVSVRVSVSIRALGSTSAAYQTPTLPVSIPSPYHPAITQRIWGSRIVVVILALFVAVLVALLLIALLQPRRSGLPARMAEFVSVPGLQTQGKRGGAPGAAEEAATPAASGFWARLDEQLQIAQIRATPAGLVGGTLAATVLGILILDVASGSPWIALLALLVPLVVRAWVLRKLARRRNQFSEQLPDTLQMISSALRAGHSFAGALAVVVESSSEPTKSEMQRVVADEQLGIPLETAIAIVVRRMENRDLEQVALVAQLQRDAGGNSAEVVDRVAETIRERFELRRLVQTLTVQGRMSRWIVSALPVALVLMLMLINPHYLHPLVSNLFGKVLLVFAALLVVGGSLTIKRIVDIKV